MDVPLWLYLLTTFGVAAIGIGGVWLSNRSHARLTTRQLDFERERSEADREHEREQWRRDQRTRVYYAHVASVSTLGEDAARVIRGKSPSVTSSEAFAHQAEFDFWASASAMAANDDLRHASILLRGGVMGLEVEGGGAMRKRLMDAQHVWANKRLDLVQALRRDLGVEPLDDSLNEGVARD